MVESRLHKSLLNARVNLIFYFISLLLSFFSRKVFLDCFGADFLGLVGTLQNLLGFLNLAELGVSTAIGYVLYKPLFSKDELKINEIISVFGYLYQRIGFIIIGAGVILGCFLPLIFPNTDFSMIVIYCAFYSFLASSLIGYFANYKQTLLAADQRNYVVTAYFQTSTLVKTIIQIVVTIYTRNYYYWIAIELVLSIIHSIILNWKIKQVYPWLSSDIKLGKLLFKKYPEVVTYTKQLFVHRIAYFVQGQITPLLIYAFVSLKIVAYYGNYTIIISKLGVLVNSVLGGTQAGIGSLIAEGDRGKIQRVFWELMACRYFIAGILVFGLYYLTEPFISLWLGKEYVLGKTVLILILLNTYIGQTRGAIDQFLHGFGLFADVWAPCAEAIISLAIALIAGYYYGLNGILLGASVSMLLIVCIWKPYYLYRKGFKLPLVGYCISLIKLVLIFAVSWLATRFILNLFVSINPVESYLYWVAYAVVYIGVFALIQFLLMYLFEQGMRDFFHRMKGRFFHR